MQYQINDCGAEFVIVLSAFYKLIKQIQSGTKAKTVIVSNIKEYLPPAMRLLFTLLKEKKEGHHITLDPGDLRLGDLLRQDFNFGQGQM